MLRPIDGAEVSQEEIDALKPKPPEEKSEPGSEPSEKTPEGEEKKEVSPEGGEKVPYHEDPTVQLYIERQVAKRVGEGNKAWEERLARLEQGLTKKEESPSIFGGLKLEGNDAVIAKALVLQAKKEMYEDLKRVDGENRAQIEKEEQALLGWLNELKTTSVIKSDDDITEIVRLLKKYGKGRDDEEDKSLVLELFEQTRTAREAAIAEGKKAGEEEGIKKAQEAKVGSGRKGAEIGKTDRTYQDRRLHDRNMDDIVAQEIEKIRGS